MQDTLQHFFGQDPLWGMGAIFFVFFPAILFLSSAFRNPRREWWFHFTLLFIGALSFMTLFSFSTLHDALIAYRADWSMVYLVQHASFMSGLTLWFFLTCFFGGLSALVFLSILLSSVMTFQLHHVLPILRKSSSYLGITLLFSTFVTFGFFVLARVIPVLGFSELFPFMECGLMVFFLVLVLQSVDQIIVVSPRSWFRLALVTGLMVLFADQLWWSTQSVFAADISVRAWFLGTLLRFFIGVLLASYFSAASVSARFVSPHVLDEWAERMSMTHAFLLTLLFSPENRTYFGQMMVKGIALSLFSAAVLLCLLQLGQYLVLVPSLFLSYFLLFSLLDRQFDFFEKGVLVREPSTGTRSIAPRSLPTWRVEHDDLVELSA